MELTVIIVNWNTRDMLRDCLYSLKRNSDNQNVKIIVVDNSSKDESIEMVQALFPEVKIINSGENIGFGRANNLALPYADTPFILFLNPDTIVLENTIQKMVDFLKADPLAGATTCKLKFADGVVHTLGLQWFPTPLNQLITLLFITAKTEQIFRKLIPYHDPNESGYVSKICGACIMVRRDVIDQVGYFDERFFMYGEDVDLSRRIISAGWKLYYLSDAEIIHNVAGAGKNSTSQFSTLMTCESIAKLMQKYYGWSGRVLYASVIFIGSSIRLFLLFFLKILSALSLISQSINYEQSFSKYVAMLKWSLNLQKPIIKS